MSYSDWQHKVAQMLIDAGPAGVKQVKLVSYLGNEVDAHEIVTYLEWLQHQQKVDKYVRPNLIVGRDATIWRATTKILEV